MEQKSPEYNLRCQNLSKDRYRRLEWNRQKTMARFPTPTWSSTPQFITTTMGKQRKVWQIQNFFFEFQFFLNFLAKKIFNKLKAFKWFSTILNYFGHDMPWIEFRCYWINFQRFFWTWNSQIEFKKFWILFLI